MCHAIIRVKYRVKETATVQAETPDDLAERLATMESNEEIIGYRVYLAQPKRVRVSGWEDQP